MAGVTIAGLTLDGVPVEMGTPGASQDGFVVTYNNATHEVELKAPTPTSGGGNLVTVDDVYGNDSTGARSGLPFKTITAATAAAVSGDVVYVLPGTYNEAITLKNGVSLIGASERAVIIQKLGVTAHTTLVTMAENCHLSEVTLNLTSTGHYNLTGITWPGTSTQTSTLHDFRLNVDNQTAGTGGTSNVYGIHASGTDSVADITNALQDGVVVVNTTGNGTKRAILLDGATSLNMSGVNVSLTKVVASGGSYITAETNHASAIMRIRLATITGATASPDISQTLGQINLGAVSLTNANANGLGFRVDLSPSSTPFVYMDPGGLTSGARYLRPGTTNATVEESFIRVPNKAIVRSLSVRALTGPGGSHTDTWTVRINGADTTINISLTGSETSKISTDLTATDHSAGVNGPFDLSVRQDISSGSSTTDISVVVSLY